MNTLDLGLLVALLGFTAWGAWRGPLRPLLALGLLGAAFVAAGMLAGPLTPTAARVTGLPNPASEATAWGAIWFGAIVFGSAVLAVIKPWVGRVGAGGGLGRILGAALGLAQGAAWCAILGYLLIGWSTAPGTSGGTSLSRAAPSEETGAPGERASEPVHGWRRGLAGSHTGAAATLVGQGVRERLALPDWIAARMVQVEATLAEE